MMGNLFRFFRHWLTSRSRYGVHSPFVYEFVTKVLPHRGTEAGAKIEALRKKLRSDRSTRIKIEDFGAGYGGKHRPVIEKTMAQVVNSSARGRREGELLHRICLYYQPKVVLELGGNLGFSTLYQASALKGATLISVEGAKELHRLALRNYEEVKIPVEVRQETGEFGQVLNRLLGAEQLAPDYVLMDGNHRYEPTMKYFHQLLPCMADGGIIILDDINWSDEMRRAWKEIAGHPEVSVSIDLFFMGIVFIRRPQIKEHFRFRFMA